MIARTRRNDRLSTERAFPSVVLRLALVVVVAVAAVVLIPVIGWQVLALAAVVVGVVFPPSFGGWIAIVCLAVGMLMSEPNIWRAMLAVLVVHLLHAGSSLLLLLPRRSRVLLAALRPTGIRLLKVQLLVQPLTVLVMLAHRSGGGSIAIASIAGAVALGAFVVLFLRGSRRAGDVSGPLDRPR